MDSSGTARHLQNKQNKFRIIGPSVKLFSAKALFAPVEPNLILHKLRLFGTSVQQRGLVRLEAALDTTLLS